MFIFSLPFHFLLSSAFTLSRKYILFLFHKSSIYLFYILVTITLSFKSSFLLWYCCLGKKNSILFLFLEYKKQEAFSFHRFDRDSFSSYFSSAPYVAFFSSEFLSLIVWALLLSFPQMRGDPWWSLGWGTKIWLEIPCVWGCQPLGSTSL